MGVAGWSAFGTCWKSAEVSESLHHQVTSSWSSCADTAVLANNGQASGDARDAVAAAVSRLFLLLQCGVRARRMR